MKFHKSLEKCGTEKNFYCLHVFIVEIEKEMDFIASEFAGSGLAMTRCTLL